MVIYRLRDHVVGKPGNITYMESTFCRIEVPTFQADLLSVNAEIPDLSYVNVTISHHAVTLICNDGAWVQPGPNFRS